MKQKKIIIIKEIWGNKEDVIIKFEDSNKVWFAASDWMSISYQYTRQWLKDNGYRLLNIESCINKNKK